MKHFNIRSTYTQYVENSEEPINVSLYCNVIKEFLKFAMSHLFRVGEFVLPERLGVIQINGRKANVRTEDGKIKGLCPDWKATKDLWARDEEAKNNKQLVFHFNEDTNGVRYKFKWFKKNSLVSNKTLYDLVFTRANKRKLASLIKEGKEYLIKT